MEITTLKPNASIYKAMPILIGDYVHEVRVGKHIYLYWQLGDGLIPLHKKRDKIMEWEVIRDLKDHIFGKEQMQERRRAVVR